MIHLHRIEGEELVLNADLIELIGATPDTVITLVDGRKIVVQESPDAVVDAVRRFRASVLASAEAIRSQPAELLAFPGGKTDDWPFQGARRTTDVGCWPLAVGWWLCAKG